MKSTNSIAQRPGIAKVLSIVLMCCCLCFLTSVNYVLYPYQMQASAQLTAGQGQQDSKSDIPPSGPTEEKSCSQSFSFLEEFLHDPHPVLDFGVSGQSAMHGMADPGKILVYHGELLSPPPEL